jgi:hypothetical protein
MLLGFGKGSYIFDQEDAQAIAAEMYEEQLTPMASGRTLLADADSIPEIRDGLISFDDLAIRVDKVDARAFAISEASRLAALKKKQFIERHHDDPATWYPHTASPAEPLEDSVAITTEQLSGASTSVPDDLRYSGHVAQRFLSRFSRRELSVAAAMLAITTVSIAALPSIFGRAPGEETVSASDNQSRVIQDVVDTGQSGTTHGTVIVEVEDLPASLDKIPAGEVYRYSFLDQNRQPVVDAAVQTAAVATVHGQHESADAKTVSSNFSEASQAIADEPLLASGVDNTDANYHPAAGYINRNSSPEQGQLSVAPATIQKASVAALVGRAGAIQDKKITELLSLGQRAIDEYRLMTPEGDNAYGYFQAVLGQDPANKAARAGIKEIIDQYIALTRRAAGVHDNDRARRYVERGLSIQPDNSELLALRDSIDSGGVLIVERGVPLSRGRVSAMEQASREDTISRITSFFKKRKDEAVRAETTVPVGWDG